jgi:hypothetical protein
VVVTVPISPGRVRSAGRPSCARGDQIFHAYATYARGTECVGNACTLLDLTALGRQEDWKEPKGRVEPGRGGDPHVHQLTRPAKYPGRVYSIPQ